MSNIKHRTVGKLTIAAGIAAVLTMITVLTGVGSGNWLLGGLGDLMDVLSSALVVPLFIFLGGLAMAGSPILGRAVQIVGISGAVTKLTGALLIFSGIMAYEDAVPLVNAGTGLMGVALLLALPVSRRELGLGSGAFIFTLGVGLAMAVGLPGLFFNDAYAPLLQGEVGLAEMPPILVGLLIFAPLQLLGYPIWLLWFGRRLYKAPKPQAVQHT